MEDPIRRNLRCDPALSDYYEQINEPARHGPIVPRARRTVRPENTANGNADVCFEAMCWQEFFTLVFNAPNVLEMSEVLYEKLHPTYRR